MRSAHRRPAVRLSVDLLTESGTRLQEGVPGVIIADVANLFGEDSTAHVRFGDEVVSVTLRQLEDDPEARPPLHTML